MGNIKKYFTPTRQKVLSISALEEMAGMPPRTLYKFLKGTRNLPKKHRDSLIKILRDFGFDNLTK